MAGLIQAGRSIFTTRRGALAFSVNTLAAFGGISALVQFVGQLFPSALPRPGLVTAVTVVFCAIWGFTRAYPQNRIRHEFAHPDTVVTVEAGDLFAQPGHLVVGFMDTFDTAVDESGLVSGSSVQAQLLDRVYEGDVQRLDKALTSALSGVAPLAREARENKRDGKLDRYPLGTVAVLGEPSRLIFALAYSRVGGHYVAKSSVGELWLSLSRLWDAIYLEAQQECVAMPLVGTGLARIDFLDRETILRLILLSFVSRSSERRICQELRIVLRPSDLERINLPEVGAFLRSLGPQRARP